MELNKVMAKVQKLIALAEHESTPPNEAKLARTQADALMLQYAIDEVTAEQQIPVAQRSKPGTIEVSLGTAGDITGYVAAIATEIARYCRCKNRNYARFDHDTREYFATIYGYESDLAYFNVLFTTVRLHMLGILLPQYDADKSLEDNAFRLHSVGFNWLDIARMMGWKELNLYSLQAFADRQGFTYGTPERDELMEIKNPWLSPDGKTVEPSMRMGSRIKRAYVREAKKRGVERQYIAAGGAATFRKSAAQGYLDKIYRRLQEAKYARKAGADVVLHGRDEDLEQFFREANKRHYHRCPACGKLSADAYDCDVCGFKMGERPECPNCKPGKPCRAHKPRKWKDTPYNGQAYRMGVDHAAKADLSGNARGTGQGSRTALS